MGHFYGEVWGIRVRVGVGVRFSVRVRVRFRVRVMSSMFTIYTDDVSCDVSNGQTVRTGLKKF